MKYQEKKYSCAAACILNACKVLNIKGWTEREIRKLCGTTEQGASHSGILAALEVMDLGFAEIKERQFDLAVKLLYSHLFVGPTILCVDKGAHWVLAGAKTGDNVLVIDSEKSVSNQRENGVQIYTPQNLKRYWTPYEGERYGIRIFEKAVE